MLAAVDRYEGAEVSADIQRVGIGRILANHVDGPAGRLAARLVNVLPKSVDLKT